MMLMQRIELNKDKIQNNMRRHELLWLDPTKAERLVTFALWSNIINKFNLENVFHDHAKSLEFSLSRLQKMMELEDDAIPMIRVELGTGIPSTAFGAELLIKSNSLPAVNTHPITCFEDLEKIKQVNLMESGLIPLVFERIKYFKDNMPQGVTLCQPDMQGPWNTAQLLMGEKIFYDIYDNPGLVCAVMDAITDFMMQTIPVMKEAIGEERDAFYLQGFKMPGGSRVVNCSTDMISGEFYRDIVLERDLRFLNAVGGGMIHICGNNDHCIKYFNRIENLHCLEINFNYLDVFKVADMLREDIVLMCTGPVEPPLLTERGEATLNRFYQGEFPDKKNIIFHFNDPADIDKCKKIYEAIYRCNR
jgi:uroporphyrinogen-III decarboxylase